MATLLRLCWWAYEVSLRCYPPALRDAFGSDMCEVFQLQTLDAWREGGWLSLSRVLVRACTELFTEALPARAASPAVIAGAGSLVYNTVVFSFLLWSFQNPLALQSLGNRLPRLLGLG